MVKVQLFISIVLLLLVAVFCSAQQSQELTVKAGTTPGNLFYGIDRATESIQLALTRDNVKRAEISLKHAEERLAELDVLLAKNKTKHVKQLTDDYNTELTDAEEEVAKADAKGENTTTVSQHVADMTYKHILVLQGVLDKVPEQARESIQHAINVSIRGNQQAIMSIEKETGKPVEVPVKPEQAKDAGKPETQEQGTQNVPPEQANQATTETAKGNGKLKMQITDKPATLNISKLEVTISSVKVHTSGEVFAGESCENESYIDENCTNKTIIVNQTCENKTIIDQDCENITEIVHNCTNTTEVLHNCTNVTEVQEVCINETLYNYTCAEDICEGGVFVDEICVNGTLVPGNCTNQSYINPVCHNETVVIGETCVNSTINIGETCINTTIIVNQTCQNETINIGETCENETETEENCTNSTKTRTTCNDISGDGTAGWHEVVSSPKTFDLMKLTNTKDFLGETTLGAGNYQQIRLYVSSAKLWISGVEQSLKIPSGTIKLIHPFSISSNKTTTLTIDFDASQSVHQAGSQYIMKPTIKVATE